MRREKKMKKKKKTKRGERELGLSSGPVKKRTTARIFGGIPKSAWLIPTKDQGRSSSKTKEFVPGRKKKGGIRKTIHTLVKKEKRGSKKPKRERPVGNFLLP